MLTTRQEQILRAIVRGYVLTGVAVPSEAIVKRFGIRASPATIRNEMVRLGEAGYIRRPHISAGGEPSEQGYRYYVETLLDAEEPSYEEQVLLRHLSQQVERVEREIDDWARLVAGALAGMAHNLALATAPKAAATRLRHLDLVRLQDFLALMVLVLEGSRIRRQRLALEEALSPEELNIIARRLSALWDGLTGLEIERLGVMLSPLEVQVSRAVVGCLKEEDQRVFDEPYVEGWRNILEQPEFRRQERLAQVLVFLQEREALTELFQEVPPQGVRVIIGSENRQEAIQECSVILSRYGLPGERQGALGVIGPMRMPYERTISLIRHLSSMLTDLVQGAPR